MLPFIIEEYVDEEGFSPFRDWFDDLDSLAAARIVVALSKLERGATSNVKPVGDGVLEFKIDFGPGYRLYFGRHGERLVILLAGGTKRRQSNDIEDAKRRWQALKARN